MKKSKGASSSKQDDDSGDEEKFVEVISFHPSVWVLFAAILNHLCFTDRQSPSISPSLVKLSVESVLSEQQ